MSSIASLDPYSGPPFNGILQGSYSGWAQAGQTTMSFDLTPPLFGLSGDSARTLEAVPTNLSFSFPTTDAAGAEVRETTASAKAAAGIARGKSRVPSSTGEPGIVTTSIGDVHGRFAARVSLRPDAPLHPVSIPTGTEGKAMELGVVVERIQAGMQEFNEANDYRRGKAGISFKGRGAKATPVPQAVTAVLPPRTALYTAHPFLLQSMGLGWGAAGDQPGHRAFRPPPPSPSDRPETRRRTALLPGEKLAYAEERVASKSPVAAWYTTRLGSQSFAEPDIPVYGYINDTGESLILTGDRAGMLVGTDLAAVMQEEAKAYRAAALARAQAEASWEAKAATVPAEEMEFAQSIEPSYPNMGLWLESLEVPEREFSTAGAYALDAASVARALNEMAGAVATELGLVGAPFTSAAAGNNAVETTSARLTARQGPVGRTAGGATLRLAPANLQTYQALGGLAEIKLNLARTRVIRSGAPRRRPDPFRGHHPITLAAADAPGQGGLSWVDGLGYTSILGTLEGEGPEGVVSTPSATRFSSGNHRLVLQALDHGCRPIVFSESLVPRLTMAFTAPATVTSSFWKTQVAQKRRQLALLGVGGGYEELEY
jgi:hypothetical protein